MENDIEYDTRGKQGTLFMKQSAWDFLNQLVEEQIILPKKGKGRIVEDLLEKEKARREKKQHKPADNPAA